jgi:hypothetical protein
MPSHFAAKRVRSVDFDATNFRSFPNQYLHMIGNIDCLMRKKMTGKFLAPHQKRLCVQDLLQK